MKKKLSTVPAKTKTVASGPTSEIAWPAGLEKLFSSTVSTAEIAH